MKRLFKKRRMLSASSLLLTSLFLCLFLSVGCSVIKNNAAETPNIFVNEKKDNNAEEDVMDKISSDKISIVCTTFPQYDWVKNIIGNQEKRFDITLLLDNGVDMHSYQPTIRDIAIAGSGDLFIYVGGESDAWVRDALKEANPADRRSDWNLCGCSLFVLFFSCGKNGSREKNGGDCKLCESAVFHLHPL